jgi:hypothetical protein
MDSTTHDDSIETNPTPAKAASAGWAPALLISALVLLASAVVTFAMRSQLVAQLDQQAKEQSVERERLAGKISELQASFDALTAKTPDAQGLAALDATLKETTSRLDALAARTEALESKSAATPLANPVSVAPITSAPMVATPPAPETPAPQTEAPATPASQAVAPAPDIATLRTTVESGKPYAEMLDSYLAQHKEAQTNAEPLRALASTGLGSDAEMLAQLRTILDQNAPDTRVADGTVAGQINAHMKGLIHIKKSVPQDVLAPLRSAAMKEDLATLTRMVEQLNETDRAPLASWLKQAQSRRAARDALSKLSSQTSH